MPAEWEPHAGTWFTWPRPDGISFPGRYEVIPPVYARLVSELTQVEEVHINVFDDACEAIALRALREVEHDPSRLHFHPFPAYEPWCRDHGPCFVVRELNGNRERAIVNWQYNAWGNKYPPYHLDNAVPLRVADLRGLHVFHPGIVMEGGALDVNGAGVVLTTESCLLNPNRNPDLNQEQIELCLKAYLGAHTVWWLGDGIAGDDTDGHVDDLTRFVSEDTVVTVVEENEQDENYLPLQENLKRLKDLKFSDGRPLKVLELPMPAPLYYEDQRLPASYANFYIANQRVLVPTYRDPKDDLALEILQKCFPDRKVLGIDSTDLIWGLGSFHCISQQEPLGAS